MPAISQQPGKLIPDASGAPISTGATTGSSRTLSVADRLIDKPTNQVEGRFAMATFQQCESIRIRNLVPQALTFIEIGDASADLGPQLPQLFEQLAIFRPYFALKPLFQADCDRGGSAIRRDPDRQIAAAVD